jgi:DNA-binding CsgD family transcriptional regulator
MPSSAERYQPIQSNPTAATFRRCERLLVAIAEANSIVNLERVLADCANTFGCKRMGPLISNRGADRQWRPIGLAHNMEEVDREYFRRELHLIDPGIARARDLNRPIAWGMSDQRSDPDQKVQNFYRFHDEMGNPRGLAVAVHSPRQVALLALTVDEPETDFVKRIPELAATIHLMAIHMADAIWRLSPDLLPRPATDPLTQRERECLTWVAAGKTAWEISTILHISERTVVAHTENAKRKLGAKTLPQAVALALFQGAITL